MGDGVRSIKMGYDNYAPTEDDETNILSNKLKGTYVNLAKGDTDYPTDKFYIFSGNPATGEVGFYRSTGSLAAYKAWLEVGSSSVLTFKLVFDGNGAVTGIETVSGDTDGNAFSWDNPASWTCAAIYDLQGRRISQLQKGNIYIVNGQKMYYK